jgi:predicted amidohydrolase YtcJ
MAWGMAADELHAANGRIAGLMRKGRVLGQEVYDDNVLTLPGGVILPPFFDGHLHLDLGGKFLGRLQLQGHRTAEATLKALQEERAKTDGWLIAIGLHESSWPPIDQFHAATAGAPALVFTRDYHSAFINREAIAEFGLTRNTPLPEGGSQELDDAGNPTGLLRENAVRWAEEHLPSVGKAGLKKDLNRAFEHLLSMGVLGVSDASDVEAWPVLLEMEERGELPIRVEHWRRCLSLDRSCFSEKPHISGCLRRTRIKTFSDGALGSRSAWMLREYSDQPGWRGEPVPDLSSYEDFLRSAVDMGWSHAIHALGDAAVRWVAEVLSRLPYRNVPHRIEHIQHTDSHALNILIDSDVVPSIQPLHRIEDAGMLLSRVGEERARWSYPQKMLSHHGHLPVLGSDWPVVSVDPRDTMQAAMSKRKDGVGMPGEELSLEQALTAYTAEPAIAAGFMDAGRLDPGLSADWIWLSHDPKRSVEEWSNVEVFGVWSRGRRVYKHPDAPE